MSQQPPSLPAYTKVANALKKTPAKLQAAQTHGLFCGLICGSPDKNKNPWESLLPTDGRSQDSRDILEQLYKTSDDQLKNFSFDFTLLLPSDSKKLTERIEALGLWCQGFLTGLKQTHVRLEHREPSDLSEALHDLMEIAQVNFDEISDNDVDEAAYVELVEYVRIAVLLIFQELHAPNTDNTLSPNDFLH